MGVGKHGDKTGGADDETAGADDRGDIRGFQLAVCCKHAVGVSQNEDKTGGSDDGVVGAGNQGSPTHWLFKHDVDVFEHGDRVGGRIAC